MMTFVCLTFVSINDESLFRSACFGFKLAQELSPGTVFSRWIKKARTGEERFDLKFQRFSCKSYPINVDSFLTSHPTPTLNSSVCVHRGFNLALLIITSSGDEISVLCNFRSETFCSVEWFRFDLFLNS